MESSHKFYPWISSIQKVALFETKSKLYLIGSNSRETRFRLLEIDRKSPELLIHEDPNELVKSDIRKFVQSRSFVRSISAYGVLGFVKFLEGYYLILVTKRTRCAFIGKHIIYTIKDTAMIRVNEAPVGKQVHPLEQRYVKMFNNVDLKSNFYFSYSYDLTRSLQYNESVPRFVGTSSDIEKDEPLVWKSSADGEKATYAFRGVSRDRFVWNSYLLKPMDTILQKDWKLEVIHGFVSQSSISIFGRPIYVCLIARRSTRYAGTRFLKRGANYFGDVANEVETEQIVIDGNRLCSFTQLRGSVPSHWSQDVSKMVPKPQIALDLSDPYGETSGKHYERLMFHYGAPIIILNLVKKREKRRHESVLSDEMLSGVEYLNQFLPPQHYIKYIDFDMARKSRGKGSVMESLAKYAESVIQQTGMFFLDEDTRTEQTGIARTNCVDCLDRTNTAQFAIGKCVLAYQLYELGFLKERKLEFESDCVTMLENLYEDHGDTLALQYGGSQLVHRIKTYRKTAAWASQGNDIIQTLSRYCSNTFSDTEKQHSINLFLGYYIPSQSEVNKSTHIWDLETDFYIHNSRIDLVREISPEPLTAWVKPFVMKHLPYSTSDKNRVVKELIKLHSQEVEIIDYYSNFYYDFKLTFFEEHIAYQISHLARNFVPTFRTNFSPFEPVRRGDMGVMKNPSLTGHSSTGSNNSSSSSMEDDSDSEDDDRSVRNTAPSSSANSSRAEDPITISSMFPTTGDMYGFEIKPPKKADMIKYQKYVQMNRICNPNKYVGVKQDQIPQNQSYHLQNQPSPSDSIVIQNDEIYVRKDANLTISEDIPIPTVSAESIDIYRKYCELREAALEPREVDPVIQKYMQILTLH
ncbi:polyphosphoinositide phosphatase-like [Uranotaenia lowii]|uniref:polyphosphoinositide phosphatase-like n=1 Tax=Uranotaenia lowii TaxID=190385 RepID=UPI0024787ADD|nr:polyphosphoinositide phosphatase-like [Uranotaenia lowii]XP_055612485.1 polyphosphoinositide phosphatase-like [Uranotaenia lowii]